MCIRDRNNASQNKDINKEDVKEIAHTTNNNVFVGYNSQPPSAGNNNLLLAASEATVTVYYNDTVTTFNVPYSAADLWYVFDYDNSTGFTAVNTMGSDSSFTADVFAPTLTEVTAVTTPTNDTTPNYTFSSIEAGTITYGGSCSSSTSSASSGSNTITFTALDDGTYDNCTIAVTDSSGNTSDNLSVTSFTVAVPPVLAEVEPIFSSTTSPA